MDDLLTMNILQALKNLTTVALRLDLSQFLPSFHLFTQGLIAAQFHQNVSVLVVLKEMVVAANVLMN